MVKQIAFNTDGNNVEVLFTPEEFYSALLSNIEKAENRVVLSSLYLGTEPKGEKLLEALGRKQRENENLQIDLLFDFNRSMRLQETTRMFTKYLDLNTAHCYLYHTSYLNQFKKTLAPKRWNEIFGVQHIKTYIFDDVCLISGANLSEEYFVNRQDRYLLIRDEKICNFLHELIRTVQKFSLRLQNNGTTSMQTLLRSLPWKNPRSFIEQSALILQDFLTSNSNVRESQRGLFKRCSNRYDGRSLHASTRAKC